MQSLNFINLKNFCAVILIGGFFAACESKVSEPNPQGVSSANAELSARVSANSSLDDKLSQIESSATKLKNVITLFRKVDKQSDDSYTPVDFALDLTTELKKGLPEGSAGHFRKAALVVVPIASLSSECQQVSAIFETQDAEITAGQDGIGIQQTGILSLRTCYSKDYVDAFEVRTSGKNIALVMKPEAFSKLFSGMIPDVLNKRSSSCDFANDDAGMIIQMNCTNLGFNLNKSENLIFDNFSYDPNADISLQGSGSIYNKQSVVERPIVISIGKKGVNISSTKIDEDSAQSEKSESAQP